MNAVAREYALDLSVGAFEPSLVQHLPGVVNVIADVLSRRCDPQYKDTWTVPPQLIGARRREVPPRVLAWWKASRPPAFPGTASREIFRGEQT